MVQEATLNTTFLKRTFGARQQTAAQLTTRLRWIMKRRKRTLTMPPDQKGLWDNNCSVHWRSVNLIFQLYILHPLRGATRLRGGQRGPGAGDQDEGARHRGREEAGVQQEGFLPLRRGVQRTGEKVMFQMMETPIRPNHLWEEQINAKQIFRLLLYSCSYSPIYLLSFQLLCTNYAVDC